MYCTQPALSAQYCVRRETALLEGQALQAGPRAVRPAGRLLLPRGSEAGRLTAAACTCTHRMHRGMRLAGVQLRAVLVLVLVAAAVLLARACATPSLQPCS